jgi:methionine synthase II (cobalamin-independent)
MRWHRERATHRRARAALQVAMQLEAGCDIVTDGELGRLSYIGIIAELAHGFEVGHSRHGLTNAAPPS